MHGPLLFLDRAFWSHGNKCVLCPLNSRRGQDMSASSTWLFLHSASSIITDTEQLLSSQSYPYLLHFPRFLPGSPGKITARACPFPCPAGTQLCLDMSCWPQPDRQQPEHWASDAGLMFLSRKQEKQSEEHKETCQCLWNNLIVL